MGGEQVVRLPGQAQGVRGRALGGFPGFAGQELSTRVGPAPRGGGEDVVAAQMVVDCSRTRNTETALATMPSGCRGGNTKPTPPPTRNDLARDTPGIELAGGDLLARRGLE